MIWKCKLSSVVRDSDNLKFTALTLFLLGGQEEHGESLIFFAALGTNTALNSQSFLPSPAAHLCSTIRAIGVG